MSEKLNIISWNARGLCSPSKKSELSLCCARFQPHLVLIQETFFTNDNNKIYIHNYIPLKKNREAHGGGLLILVRRDISFEIYPSIESINYENMSVRIYMENCSMIVTNLYIPHDSPQVIQSLKKLLNSQQHIIAGDFNAKHVSWSFDSNRLGEKLFDLMPYNGYVLYPPDTHTYINPNGNHSTIDLVLTNLPLRDQMPSTNSALISDHIAIAIEIDLKPVKVDQTRFDYSKADWKLFGAVITDGINVTDLSSSEKINEACDDFTQLIFSAREAAIPKIKCSRVAPIISATTRKLIAEKNSLQRKLVRSLVINEAVMIRSQINNVKSLIKYHVNRDRNRNWQKLLRHTNKDPKAFWRTVKMMKNKLSSAPHFTIGNSTTSDPTKIAAALANNFENAHRTHNRPPNDFDSITENNFERILEEVFNGPEDLFDDADIMSSIAALKNRKAPGCDGINSILLKNLPDSGVKQLTKIYNSCVMRGYWPDSFKKALVVPIPKAGLPPEQITSYRPISLLTTINKVFERLLRDLLLDHVNTNEILPPHQFGFRVNHSAPQQATRLAAILRNNKNQKISSGVLCLDISKAFDSVWHAGLIHKMVNFDFPNHVIRLVASYCTNRSFVVRFGGVLSDQKGIPAGTPQGSLVSPLLYCIYTADVPCNSGTELLTFADDTAIVASSKQNRGVKNKLSKALTSLQCYFDRWHIKANVNKTQYLFVPFNFRKVRARAPVIITNQHQIKASGHIKYLGVHFDAKLKYDVHYQKQRIKMASIARSLFSVTAGKALNQRNRLLIIKQVVKPTLLYAASAWSELCHTKTVALRRCFSRTAKSILHFSPRTSSKWLYSMLRMPFIEVALEQSRRQLMRQIEAKDITNLLKLKRTMIDAWPPLAIDRN